VALAGYAVMAGGLGLALIAAGALLRGDSLSASGEALLPFSAAGSATVRARRAAAAPVTRRREAGGGSSVKWYIKDGTGFAAIHRDSCQHANAAEGAYATAGGALETALATGKPVHLCMKCDPIPQITRYVVYLDEDTLKLLEDGARAAGRRGVNAFAVETIRAGLTPGRAGGD